MKRIGFTLAEILITLGIIGIIASITIPALILNTQKQEFTSLLKKNYSTVTQGLLKMSTEMGCSGDLACTGLFATGTTAQVIGDAIVPYFKVVKNCQLTADTGCTASNASQYYDGSGTRIIMDSSNVMYKFVNIDGSAILIVDHATDCTTSHGTNILSQTCGTFYIDVNGLQGPNNYGRDIFQFYITKNGSLYPTGGAFHESPIGTSKYWKTIGACQPANASTQLGNYCTGRVMDEGWQMNY